MPDSEKAPGRGFSIPIEMALDKADYVAEYNSRLRTHDEIWIHSYVRS